MTKDIITTSVYKDDSVLADDIIDPNGSVRLVAGTKLNEYIFDKLVTNNIRELKVIINSSSEEEDKELKVKFHKTYDNCVSTIKKIFQDILFGSPINNKSLVAISKEIYSYKECGNRILQYLHLLESSDEHIYYHSVNVGFYSMLIATWYKLTDEKAEQTIISGLLHDLGKMKIPDNILNKKDILTKEEYEVIKQHTIIGHEMVKSIEGIDEDIRKAILCHHERMDGSGYPYQKESKDLNIYSKIIAVADVYDAMTSNRVYKKRSTPFEVFEMFQTVGLSLFDIDIMDLLKKEIVAYLVGLRVKLSNGEVGEIEYIPLNNITCPVVKVMSGNNDLSTNSNIKILELV